MILSVPMANHRSAFIPTIDRHLERTRLRKVSFECEPDPGWIGATLQTAVSNHRSLRKISIATERMLSLGSGCGALESTMGKAACQGWSELDRLLAWFSNSHPTIRLGIHYLFPGICMGKGQNI